MSPTPGFDLLVNGTERTFRDTRDAAYAAGGCLMARWPKDAVTIRNCSTGTVVTMQEDGRAG